MRHFFVLALLAVLSLQTSAQKWTTMITEPGHNFYEIRSAFNNYWKDKDKNVKGNGYKQFKRWENFMAPRVYPSGDLSVVSQCWKNFEEFTRNNPSQKLQQSSTWTAMGPFGAMSGVASNGFPRTRPG